MMWRTSTNLGTSSPLIPRVGCAGQAVHPSVVSLAGLRLTQNHIVLPLTFCADDCTFNSLRCSPINLRNEPAAHLQNLFGCLGLLIVPEGRHEPVDVRYLTQRLRQFRWHARLCRTSRGLHSFR